VSPPGEPQMLEAVQVGQTFSIVPAEVGTKFEMHKMYYEEGTRVLIRILTVFAACSYCLF
jgi:hypothetical protein